VLFLAESFVYFWVIFCCRTHLVFIPRKMLPEEKRETREKLKLELEKEQNKRS